MRQKKSQICKIRIIYYVACLETFFDVYHDLNETAAEFGQAELHQCVQWLCWYFSRSMTDVHSEPRCT